MSKTARRAADKPQPRRRFLKQAAAGTVGAGAAAFPMVSTAQTVSMRFQSTWPAKDIFHEFANDFAKKVNDMAGGRLKIDVLPAGAVVPAFQLLEAVNKGTLDGGHGVVAYHYGKNSALALWGSGPAFGMDPNMVLAWHYYGGGKALLEEIYKSINMDVVSFLYGPMPTQPFGWFKKPIAKAEDIKGLKFRTVGLAVDMYTDMGAAVNPLPGGEIVPALDRGLIDGAEFNNASSDRVLGFPDVAGFSVDAGVCIEAHDRAALERLLRYCARPPFSMERLRKEGSKLVYRCAKQRSEPTSDKRGAKADELHLTPLELIDRIAALVPPPRTHRHRYFGVLAPNSPLRAAVTALAQPAASQPATVETAQPGAGVPGVAAPGNAATPTPEPEARPKRAAHYLWAVLIARIYEAFPLLCPMCGGQMRIIAFITHSAEIRHILNHIGVESAPPAHHPGTRATAVGGLRRAGG